MFLGAGKRLSLLERFRAAAEAETIALSMWAVEKETKVPISTLAEILIGPNFDHVEFEGFLLDVVRRLNIDVVIPNMDSATVALSKAKAGLAQLGTWGVVSDHDLCVAMYDKKAAERWFFEHQIPTPLANGFPRIAKRRFGFGSRDQFLARDSAQLQAFLAYRNPDDFLVQSWVEGQEYTVDAYVDRNGHLVAALSRKRIEVTAGEVDVSETHQHPGILDWTRRILSIPGWEGPITLQLVDSPEGPVMIEINPRFGGGVTHSIHCGLDMPRWLMWERLGLPPQPVVNWPDGSVMTRCRRDIFL